ncbi:MAG: DUF4863 family protein [Rhizobiales bacterium]|nr:DUF4863 family protein [Hyphomicrobiales bacterium]
MKPIFATISRAKIDTNLEAELNAVYPASSDTFRQIEQACHNAIDAGWMCGQGGEGRRFGRVLEPSTDTNDLSVDVVDLTDIVGPHHRHPTGEVCMIMPVTDGARFDGCTSGWCVNAPGSAHHPTVTKGRALVLYLLPEGKIEFT